MAKTITIQRPNFKSLRKLRKDNYHGGKFFVAFVMFLLCLIAGNQGWVMLPSVDALGGLVGLAVIFGGLGLLFWVINRPSKFAKVVGLLAAVAFGVVLTLNWVMLSGAFVGFNAEDLVWLVVAIVAIGLISAWLAKWWAKADTEVTTRSSRSTRQAPPPADDSGNGTTATSLWAGSGASNASS